jgi:hypothetical protein
VDILDIIFFLFFPEAVFFLFLLNSTFFVSDPICYLLFNLINLPYNPCIFNPNDSLQQAAGLLLSLAPPGERAEWGGAGASFQ